MKNSNIQKASFKEAKIIREINFFFKNNWRFNVEIIKKQIGKNIKEYLQDAR